MRRAGECQGLVEELDEARKAVVEAERERDEQAGRGEDLAAQLADVTAARDALACAAKPSVYSCGGGSRCGMGSVIGGH